MLLLPLFLLCSLTSAATIILKLQPTNILSNPNILPPSTHATITFSDGSVQKAVLRKDNTIIFDEITSVGSHLLNIYTKDYQFASYRIDTIPNSNAATIPSGEQSSNVVISLAAQTFVGSQWSDTGVSLLPHQATSGSSESQPVTTLTFSPKVLSAKAFYDVRPTFSPLSLLKNPMILLAIVGVGFTFGMPYLMDNMDPEFRAEFEERQKKMPTAALGKAMQGGAVPGSDSFDLAGYLAGQSKGSGSGADSLRERKK